VIFDQYLTISETVQDRDIVTMERQSISNGAISSDTTGWLVKV